MNLLMAVLENAQLYYEMSRLDAYVNIAGGMKNEPPGPGHVGPYLQDELATLLDPRMTIIFGEVGLSGEVRAVSQADQRVNEAAKLGFTSRMPPKVCMDKMKQWKA